MIENRTNASFLGSSDPRYRNEIAHSANSASGLKPQRTMAETRRSQTAPSFQSSLSISHQVALFWVRACTPFYSRLSFNITREVCHYLREIGVLVTIARDELRVYWTPKRRTKPMKLGQSFAGAMFAVVGETEVLCLGSYLASAAVATVDFRTLSIRQEQPMSEKRISPGVLRVDGSVYVFGGFTEGPISRSCERFVVRSGHWRSLPDMDAGRAYFLPALYRREIILADSRERHRHISLFNVDTETFALAPVQLPTHSNLSLSFVHQDTFYQISVSQVWKWRFGSNAERVEFDSSGQVWFTASEVIVSGGKAYWVDDCRNTLVTFDIPTHRISFE